MAIKVHHTWHTGLVSVYAPRPVTIYSVVRKTPIGHQLSVTIQWDVVIVGSAAVRRQDNVF